MYESWSRSHAYALHPCILFCFPSVVWRIKGCVIASRKIVFISHQYYSVSITFNIRWERISMREGQQIQNWRVREKGRAATWHGLIMNTKNFYIRLSLVRFRCDHTSTQVKQSDRQQHLPIYKSTCNWAFLFKK